MLAGFLLVLSHALAGQAQAQPGEQSASVAVLPAKIRVNDPAVATSGNMLTNALTARLSESAGFKVISPDEVEALIQDEGERQNLGCADDGCLAEIAGLLGARYLVAAEVSADGTALLWSASMLDQQAGTVVRRATVKGRSVQALLAQAEELALNLAGKPDAAALSSADAARRLGFSSSADLDAFRKYRGEHPESTTGEALTQFILRSNRESRMLAWTEAALLMLGGALLAPPIAMGLAMLMGDSSMTAGDPELFNVLNVVVGVAALALLAAGTAVTTAALVVVLVDALDLGRVGVKKSGCCRQDADLLDAERDTAELRAAGLLALLSGPLSVAGAVGLIVLTMVASSISADVLEEGAEAPDEPSLVPITACLVAPLCLFGFASVAIPVGAGLMQRPEPPLLEDGEDAPAKEKTP